MSDPCTKHNWPIYGFCPYCEREKFGVIKPCPFCGETARAQSSTWSINVGAEWWQIICNGCGASSEKHQKYADTFAAWNKRA